MSCTDAMIMRTKMMLSVRTQDLEHRAQKTAGFDIIILSSVF